MAAPVLPNVFQPIFGGLETDLARLVAEFAHEHVRGRPNVELEGRLGRIVDSATQQRLGVPILTAAALAPSSSHQFQASLPVDAFQFLQQTLGQWTADPDSPWVVRS